MKGWLSRAAVGTVLRGEQRRNRFARWAHWYPEMPVVDSRRFQGPGEPYPRHWRAFPQPWPPVTGDDPALQRVLAREVADLRGPGRPWSGNATGPAGRPVRSGPRLGLSGTQQRAIRNRAWAVLRERLEARLGREGPA